MMKRYPDAPPTDPDNKVLDAALQRALVPPRLSQDFQARLDAKLTYEKAQRKTRNPIIIYPLPRSRRNYSNRAIISLQKFPSVSAEATAILFPLEVPKPIRPYR